jgi:hypothetical protein
LRTKTVTTEKERTMLVPGVYDDGGDCLHIEEGEFLTAYGFADTPTNRWCLRAAVRRIAAAIGVEVEDERHVPTGHLA